MTITLRTATTQDLAALWQLYAEALGDHAQRKDAYWECLIAAGGMVMAEAETQIVGFGGIDVVAQEQIQYVYVAPTHQQHGIGKEILARLEEIGRHSGLRALRLHAAPTAVPFYQRAGYHPIESDVQHDHDGVARQKQLSA